MQVMFTYELAKRLKAQSLPIVANALDPGIVDTELQRYLPTKARFCSCILGGGGKKASIFARHRLH